VPSLLLHPADPCWIPGAGDRFSDLLEQLGLIDTTLKAGRSGDFRAGEQFLNLVMFLGCSPRVVLEPGEADEGQTACHLQYHLYPEVTFLSAAKRPQVRCPGCRAPAGEVDTSSHLRSVTCARCGRTVQVCALDWRRAAGFGRFFLEIGGVYPHEAVPSDKLLDSLREHSGGAWQYFYTG